MCFISNKRMNYKRLNYPLTVFKIGKSVDGDEFQSEIFGHIYKVGEEQPIIPIKRCKSVIKLWVVYKGYHSYSQSLKIVNDGLFISIIGKKDGSCIYHTVDTAYNLDGKTRIGIFEIPAGTRFLMNEKGFIVSDTITLKKIVSVREFVEKCFPSG